MLTLMLALAAQAAPESRPLPPMVGLMRADADSDGAVTRAEAVAEMEERFARADVNKDGKITREEIASMRKRVRETVGRAQPQPR